jgi:hypothetical protein
MAISLIAFDRLDFRTFGFPQNGAHLVHQFRGSNSDAVSQLFVREVILAEPILQGLPPACRAFYERSRSRWRTDGGEKVCPARVSRNG